MRKFTIGYLEIRKLNLIDIISLSVFAAIDIGRLYLNYFSYSEMYKFFYDLGFAFMTLGFLTSPFLIRFTNIIFSMAWIVLSLIYIVEGDRILSYVSLLLFILYHIVRYFFRRKYNKEFIPPDLGRGWSMSYYSELEDRSSGEEDVKYLKMIAWAGTFILFICLWLSGKRT